ncbi:hypothetical protein U9M48_000361 [Paspalum notatum var. saurae]|uniref:Uncharacterized protein n=1 Tax=Paspalum notatum var. saurae TaxID=547442 RepID=A0AAQ3SEI6_PASNO
MGAARPPQAAQMPATQAGSGCCPDALGPPRTVIRSQPARRPLGDITNFEDVRLGSEDAVLRLKEQKSKRAREKYASLPEEKKEEKRAKARASYYRRKSIKEHSMLPNQKTSVPNDLFPDAATDEMTRLGQSNDIDGDGFQDDDWLHRNDLYVRHSVDECKKTCEDCNGVFPTMSSTVINGARDNTPYSAFKREKLREQYSRLSADAKHDKSTRSMEMRARRNSTRQVHDTPQQSALTQHASRPSAMMTRAGVRGVQKLFDSGLWEPDDPMHGVEENDLDNQDLDDGDVDMYDDAEPRPSNNRGNMCRVISMADHYTNN